MTLYALQQGLSLRFANQAVALVCGIFGSLLWDSWPCSSPCGYSGASPGGITACSLWCGWNGMRPPADCFLWRRPEPLIWPSCACGRPSFSLWDGLCSSERRCEAWYCAVSGRS